MQNNFFGSKLNTVLLLVLIVLMVFALRIMLKDKETYLPSLSSTEQGEKYFSGIITDEDGSCASDAWCLFEIDDKYWVIYNPGLVAEPLPMGVVDWPLGIGSEVEVYARQSNESWSKYINPYTIIGDKKYYIKNIGPTAKWVKWPDTIVEIPVEKYAPRKDSASYFLKYVGSPQLAMGVDGEKRCIGDQDYTICAIGTDEEVIKYYENSKNEELYRGRWTKVVESASQQRIRFYAPDFSLDYSVNAVLETNPEGGSFGVPTYRVFRPQGVLELVMLISTSKLGTGDLQGCTGQKSRTEVFNGKTMTACDSTGDPTTTYVYTKGAKTLIAHLSAGQNSTIDPASFEIK